MLHVDFLLNLRFHLRLRRDLRPIHEDWSICGPQDFICHAAQQQPLDTAAAMRRQGDHVYEQPFELLLLDLKMPGLDGIQVAQRDR